MAATIKLMQEEPSILQLEPQPSRLLRLLALHAGRAVPLETAIDVLSATGRSSRSRTRDKLDAPSGETQVGPGAVYTYIRAVRAALGENRIETRRNPTAYALVLQRGDYLDVAEFESLHEQASTLTAEGDLAGAVKTYDRALSLWAANPARGLDFSLVTDEKFVGNESIYDSQYAEMRLKWADALTRLGESHRMDTVVEELNRLVSAQLVSLYDERIWRLRSAAYILADNISLAIDLFDEYANLGGKASQTYLTLIERADEGTAPQQITSSDSNGDVSLLDSLRKALKTFWSDHAARTVAGSQRLHVSDLSESNGLWIPPRAMHLGTGEETHDALAELVERLGAGREGAPARFSLLGSPGLGKSTLGLRLFKLLLDAWLTGQSKRIPLFLDLRSVKGEPLESLLRRDFISTYFAQSLFSQSAAARWAEEMRALDPIVVLDSLDEFFLGRSRHEAQSLMRAPFLLEASAVLCRSQFYTQYLQASDLAARFEPIELSPWRASDREQYVDSYFRHFFPSEAEGLVRELSGRLRRSPSMAQVCSAPVRLNMALELFSPGEDRLPREVDLLSLYSRYVSYVCAVDAAREGSTTDADQKLEIMKELAWRYYDEGSMGEADAPLFSRTELRSFLEEMYPDRTEDQRGLVFLDLLDGSLLESTREHRLDAGSNLLHFSHKSFQEYFVATFVYEAMVHDTSKTLDVMRQYLSPEVGEFMKEHIKRVNRYPRICKRVAANGSAALEDLLGERAASERLDDRLRIAIEQLYYYIGGIELPDLQDKLESYLRSETDPWLARGLAIGLAFSGRYEPVNSYIEQLRDERQRLGDRSLANAVNIGSQLSYFGDQPFDPARPDVDLGASNCDRTVATFLYQLSTETERGCWRIDLYSLGDLWNWRPRARDSYKAALVERADEVREVVANLRGDEFSQDWPELQRFADIAVSCGVVGL